MKAWRMILLMVGAVCVLSACNTPEPKSSYKTQDGEQISTIPWNKPQKWEQGGQLGGAMGN